MFMSYGTFLPARWIPAIKGFFYSSPNHVLYPWELEIGSYGRPSDCLVRGFVRTLKNYFKTTCREFRWCIV